ncbi:MAG: DUF2304 domain-containing protein [Pirellulales bacterium]
MTTLTLFQWIAVSVILLLLIAELVRAVRGHVIRRVWALRVTLWIGAGLAIYRPEDVTRLARAVGIERGADLVLYLSVLAFMATSFYLYKRCIRLQQDITRIVRHISLYEADEQQVNR